MPSKQEALLGRDAGAEGRRVREILRDRNTRPSYLSPEKSLCGQETAVITLHGTSDWFKKWERSMTRLYIVTLFI